MAKTNEEVYKTSEERIKAFEVFCDSHDCELCEIGKKKLTGGRLVCAMNWLARKADEEKPENCPFCGGECRAVQNSDGEYVVGCDMCCYTSKDFECKAAAIAAHNRVARSVRAAKEGDVK